VAELEIDATLQVAVLFVSAMMRVGCATMLGRAVGIEVVHVGSPEQLDGLSPEHIDVAVVGITPTEWDDGASAVRSLVASGHCVLAVLGPTIAQSVALDAGAQHCVSGIAADESTLVDAVRGAVRAPVPDAQAKPPTVISPRERQVLKQLVLGRTDREIAETLGISIRTVQSHLDRIREKTRRRRRAELTVLAFELGIAPRSGET